MKKILNLFTILIVGLNSFGQSKVEKITQTIVEEGKKLYKSEMASWYGTDIFVEKFKETDKIGGYFSYSENEISKCIFFSKEEKPKVIGTITFDDTFDVKNAKTELNERNFSESENVLFEIRRNALKIINSDTIFKRYEKTDLNLIPIISNGEKKVYVLTGPKESGVVIFGNDYLLTFDKKNNIKNRKQLHKNIIKINYDNKEENKGATAIHSHLPETGDFITATDICTTMLYEKFAKWKAHNVISKKYLSIWNCETNTLFVMTTDAVKKITENKTEK
jgi:hypothetical protein